MTDAQFLKRVDPLMASQSAFVRGFIDDRYEGLEG